MNTLDGPDGSSKSLSKNHQTGLRPLVLLYSLILLILYIKIIVVVKGDLFVWIRLLISIKSSTYIAPIGVCKAAILVSRDSG